MGWGRRLGAGLAAAVMSAGVPLLGAAPAAAIDLAETANYLRSGDGGDSFLPGSSTTSTWG